MLQISRGFQKHPDDNGDETIPLAPEQRQPAKGSPLLPRPAEAANLLVPVAFSASHVAYSSVRMEPQYMILGHAAGLAAKMAIDGKVAMQDIDVAALQARLKAQRAVFTLPTP